MRGTRNYEHAHLTSIRDHVDALRNGAIQEKNGDGPMSIFCIEGGNEHIKLI